MWTRDPFKTLIFKINKLKTLAGTTNLEQLQLDFRREESPLFETLLGWGPWVFRAQNTQFIMHQVTKKFSCCVPSRFSPSLEICDAEPNIFQHSDYENTWHPESNLLYGWLQRVPFALLRGAIPPTNRQRRRMDCASPRQWGNSSSVTAQSLSSLRKGSLEVDESRAEQSRANACRWYKHSALSLPPSSPRDLSRSSQYLQIHTLMDDKRLLPTTLFVSGGWLARLCGDGEGGRPRVRVE